MCPTDLKEHGVLHEDSETEFAGRARKPKAVSAGAVFEELPGADCPQVNPRSRGERPGSTVRPEQFIHSGCNDGNRRLISRQKTSGWDGRSANGRWDRIDGNIAPLAGRNKTAKGQIP